MTTAGDPQSWHENASDAILLSKFGEKYGAQKMKTALLALATAASLSLAGSADAQASPQPNLDQAHLDAGRRLNQGLDRYSHGDYDGARVAFAQAYAALASIELLYNLARAEVKSDHALEAMMHLRQILRDPTATEEDRAKAAHLIDEVNRVTAHVAIDAPSGSEIVIDHVPSGAAPTANVFDVFPGKHVCEARSNGVSRVVEVIASPGTIVTARFALDAAPTVSAPVAVPPPVEAAVPLRDAQMSDRESRRRPESRGRVVVPIVLGTAAAVALGVGAGLGLMSKGKENDAANFRANNPQGFCANRASPTCEAYANILNSQQDATNAERVLLVGGGVLAVGAVVTYLLWPHGRRPEEGTAVWIAPTLGGAMLGGTY